MARFVHDMNTRIYFVTGTLTVAAPTVAQITAGTRLDTILKPDSVEGFTSDPTTIDATDLASVREEKVPGRSTTPDGKMVFYRSNVAAEEEQDAWDDLVVGDAGYMVFCLNGAPAIGGYVDIFAVIISAKNVAAPAGGAAATWNAGFAVGEQTLNEIIAS